MSTLNDDFEAWFQSVELGDGDVPLPEPKDTKRWNEYVQRHSLALAAAKWATERVLDQAPVVQPIEKISILESIRRANSCLRYHAYRKSIGNPIPLRISILEWVKRYRFERTNRAVR